MNVSREEAAHALEAVRRAESNARAAFRAHQGHFHFWIWGLVWIAMATLVQTGGGTRAPLLPWLSLAGITASFLTGFFQSNQVRQPFDRRFLGALAVLIGFALLVPFIFRPQNLTVEATFAYIALVVAQAYVVAGLWFDTYMTWVGVLLAGLVLAGLFLFSGIFWIWIAVACGGTLIGTGFYVRFFWR